MKANQNAGRILTHTTRPVAASGPATAPRLSPARSRPYARPYARGVTSDASRESLAGLRSPRDAHAMARRTPTGHTAVARPMAPGVTAVPT
ncbi:hypothetical protein GCM10010433_53010 [Streptomyces pulveraceus]